MVQVIHEDDVGARHRARAPPGRARHLQPRRPGAAPALAASSKMLGRPSLPIPHPLATTMLKPLWRLRMASFPAPELDHIRYVCMVDDARARESARLRAHEARSNETVSAVDEGRWRR